MATSLLIAASLACSAQGEDTHVTLRPREYPHALKNPLKGFRPRERDGSHEFGTLCRTYLKWNELERNEADGIEQIMAACNVAWKGVETHNIKVIPRVYLHWKGDRKYWPDDMTTDDYESEQFKRRLVRLVERLGRCWDNDPRVAWIQMGIIGKWGEHHSPKLTPEMEKLLGDTFTRVFTNKMVTVRHPWEFLDYEVGIYWDSWAHKQQMGRHGDAIEKLGDRWHTHPMGGEAAYNWGRWREQPGDDPNDTLRDPVHRTHFLNTIRRLHCNNLGWVAEYDATDPDVRAAAEEVQKAFGYRFIIEQVEFPKRLDPGKEFAVRLKVRNDGSSPFYADWPLEVSLLNPETRKVAWKATFDNVDIRTWLPGDQWDAGKQVYTEAPETYEIDGAFELPPDLKRGPHILSIAILDPAGMLPSARFAVRNYFNGGRHPMGLVGVGTDVPKHELDPSQFDDPARDDSLHYVLTGRE